METADHVLVVDDDAEIRGLLRDYLQKNGYRVSAVADGRAMWAAFAAAKADIVVLDVMMPGDDGLTLCRDLRARSQVPIIMLTARGEETDRIVGLEMGADDYLPKPFNPRELLARIKSILRRTRALPDNLQPDAAQRFNFAGWMLDTATRNLQSPAGVVVALSGTEFRLLRIFLAHPNRVLTRDQLIDLMLSRDATPFDRSIDVQVSRLRHRLNDDAAQPELIKTVRGQGYVLAAAVEAGAMMRWLPRTLFARMVLVLLGGLIVAQFLSFAVHWRERGEFVMRTAGLYSAERVAEIIKLLDATQAAERARIVAVLNSPPLRVTLAAAGSAVESESELIDEAAQYEALLKAELGAAYPLKVSVTAARRRGGPGPGMMHGYGRPPGAATGEAAPLENARGRGLFAAYSFVVQTQLADGTALTLDARRPQEVINWPYRMLVSLAVLLIVVCAVTLFAVRWVTRPLNTLAAAAEDLGNDINRRPLDEQGPLEVSRAARAFNAMQTKLAALISDRTRIFSAMSHDLKTPITRLRLRTELLDDAALRDKFTQDLKEMEDMVGAALDFMRGLDNSEAAKPIDITALLESIAADAREVGGVVAIEGVAQAPYIGHPQSLKRCLTNLLDNAVKYGVSAVIAVVDSPAQLRVCVRDQGPGIDGRELERVFEPFYRVEASRNRATGGSGLGLTIARNIARAHGGDLLLRNRGGGGLEAVLTLPRRS